jgi:hypothetical protein
MARFSVNNRLAGAQQALVATFKSQIALTATTGNLARGALVDLSLGADGLPNTSDCQIVYDVSRCTGVGTGTVATPNPIDGQVGASLASATVNHTVEPPVTAASSLYAIALNQRSSIRLFFDQGFRWPAAANAGLVVRALSPLYTSNVLITTLFDE